MYQTILSIFFILQLKYPAEVLLCNCTTVASIYLELLFCSCPSVLLWYSAAIRIQNQISLKVWFYIPEWIFFKHSIIFYLFLFVYFYRLNWIQTFILLYNLSLSTVKNIHPGKCFIRHSWILSWESPIVLSIWPGVKNNESIRIFYYKWSSSSQRFVNMTDGTFLTIYIPHSTWLIQVSFLIISPTSMPSLICDAGSCSTYALKSNTFTFVHILLVIGIVFKTVLF